MSDTFDTYYDILPYHSFHNLQMNEGELPLDENVIPEELLAAMDSGELEDLKDLNRLYGINMFPPNK